MSHPHQLRVSRVIVETAEAKTLVLEIPNELQRVFQHQAGQHLVIEYEKDNRRVRGAFSICTAPHEAKVAITIKKGAEGMYSTLLHAWIREGDALTVFPPAGQLINATDPDQRVTYYFMGSDGGITSLFALIKDILESEPLSTVHLLLANPHINAIIYRTALDKLAEFYADQFRLKYFLTSPSQNEFIRYWDGQVGDITPEDIDAYLLDFPKQTLNEKFFICGPSQMMDAISNHLVGLGKEQILAEPVDKETVKMETKQNDGLTRAKVHLDGETVEIDVKEQSILQTLIDAGYDPPFSCTSGVCTTCMAKLKSGSVEMEVNYGLDEDEVAAGFILTCQSHPTSDEIELTYDV